MLIIQQKLTSTGASISIDVWAIIDAPYTESKTAFDAYSYQTSLYAKLAELHDL